MATKIQIDAVQVVALGDLAASVGIRRVHFLAWRDLAHVLLLSNEFVHID